MSRLSCIPRLAFLPLALCVGLQAQSAKWDGSFKVFGGATTGGVKDNLIQSTPNFGGGVEATYALDKDSALVFDLGFRFFPGTNSMQSFIVLPTATAATIGRIYSGETRDRKVDGTSWQASALYRRNAFTEGMYWQAGLRIGFNKAKQTDTGAASSYTQTSATAWTVTATRAIDSVDEKKTTAIGLLGGIGYHFTDMYSGELNVFQTKFEGAAAGKQNGTVVELAFGVRF